MESVVKIAICGVLGKMGGVVQNEIESRNCCKVVAGVDLMATGATRPFPLYTNVGGLLELTKEDRPNVLVDFSHPSALTDILNYAKSTGTAVIIASTGYTPEQVEEIKKASEIIPVFFTANMSVGVNLLISLARRAAAVLGERYDIEIIEMHHNQKLDAPSGTALALADAINDELNATAQYVYDRHSVRKKRDKSEIGIHSVRGGTIVGEHSVIFAGRDETFTLNHQATSKEIFAVGAVNAALFLAGKSKGFYDMGDIV